MSTQSVEAAVRQILDKTPGTLASILDAINDPLFIVNTDKKIVYFNRRAEEVTGFTREEVMGQPCIVGIRCSNCLHECALFEQKSVRHRKLLIHTRSGKTLEIVKNAEVFTDENGKIIGGVETFRDVTRLNKHRKRVTAENISIKSVFNHLDQGVMVLDARQQIVLCNTYFADEFGYNPQHLRNKPVTDYLPKVDTAKLQAAGSSYETTTGFLDSEGRTTTVHLSQLEIETDENSEAESMLLIRKVRGQERLRGNSDEEYSYRGLISRAPSMVEIFKLSETISDSDVSVLIQGESGTGKEMMARAIHDASIRKDKPFHVVNCAVFNENLLESELFGHCRGAFTGAVSDKIGRFELADKGTLFLDEIGELPPKLQVKLLRFLQDQKFERVGEWKTRQVDVRIIAATNRNLTQLIESGQFRDDLFYRINVIPVFLPPLRDRKEDISLLVEYFISKVSKSRGLAPKVLSEEALAVLREHHWPGNIRELQNAVLHALTCCKNSVLLPRHLPRGIMERANGSSADNGTRLINAQESQSIEMMEREHLLTALKEHKFNRTRTAESLGITRTTLWRKMKRFNLQ